MRERPVSQGRIDKYATFIEDVFQNSFHNNPNNSAILFDYSYNHHVSSAATSGLITLGIIEKISPIKWNWKADSRNFNNIAIRLLDYLLHKNKKTIHTPIPELSKDIAETLKQIRDNIASTNEVIQRNNISRAKRSKDLPGEQVHGETLFTEADKRFELIKAIAPGFYSSIGDAQNFTEKMEKASKRIIQTADYLLNLSKTEVNPKEQ